MGLRADSSQHRPHAARSRRQVGSRVSCIATTSQQCARVPPDHREASGARDGDASPARHPDGNFRHVEVTLSNLLEVPEVGAIVCNASDVTQQVMATERLRYAATRDSMTGLLNTQAFLDEVSDCLTSRAAEREARSLHARPRPVSSRQRQPRARRRKPAPHCGRRSASGRNSIGFEDRRGSAAMSSRS